MSARRLLAGFEEPEPLFAAARGAPAAGLRVLSLHTPFPVEVPEDVFVLLAENDQRPWRNGVAELALAGGLTGGLVAYGMQWYANVLDYPILVAGRPDHSWPAFVPVTFELTVLAASLAAAFGMLALNGLPRLHHRLFGVDAFSRAMRDRFFLEVEEPAGTEVARSYLVGVGAVSVSEVPDETP